MKVTRPAIAAVISSALAAVMLGSTPASAAPLDTMDAAFDRTMARAQARGVTVDTTVRSPVQRSLEGTAITLPRRSAVRIRWSTSPDGSSSWRVTQGRKFLGAAGVNAREGAWSTLSALIYGTPREFADSRGLSMTTALTRLDAAWGYDGPQGVRSFPGEPWTVDSLGTRTLPDLLPATGGRPSQSWTSVRERRASGGRMVITARAENPAGSVCSYPSIRVVLRSGLVDSSRWTERCGSVTTTYSSKATYRPKVTSAPGRALTQDEAFAIPVPGQDPSWPTIVAAVLKTARGAGVSAGAGTPDTSPAAVTQALMPLYTVMEAGNPGQIEASVATSEPPVYDYVITPRPGASSLGTGEDRNPITKIALTIDANGFLRTLTVTQQVPALADPVTTTSTFVPLSPQP